jgi:putrescine aminotransferase
MRHVNESMIIAPPLVISRSQIDELVDKAGKSLDATLAALQR